MGKFTRNRSIPILTAAIFVKYIHFLSLSYTSFNSDFGRSWETAQEIRKYNLDFYIYLGCKHTRTRQVESWGLFHKTKWIISSTEKTYDDGKTGNGDSRGIVQI